MAGRSQRRTKSGVGSAVVCGADRDVRNRLRKFLEHRCGVGRVMEVQDSSDDLLDVDQHLEIVLLDRKLDPELRRRIYGQNGIVERVAFVVVTALDRLAEFVESTSSVPALEESEPRSVLESVVRQLGGDGEAPRLEPDLVSDHGDEGGRAAAESLREEMGPSAAVASLAEDVREVAPTDFTVLIVGETGVGKELVARAIHGHSARAGREFVPVDCGAVADSIIESELFGHEEGAFAGATRDRDGKFSRASDGTLFLDEISTMSTKLQGTLLRVLEQGSFYRVGGTEEIEVDTRVVAASNTDVQSLDEFRDDLYYRIAEYVIEVPPLRERMEDVPHLARKFARETSQKLHRPPPEFSSGALDALEAHDWPGNVRELRNYVRRAVLACDGERVRCEDLDVGGAGDSRTDRQRERAVDPGAVNAEDMSLKEVVKNHKEAVERRVIADVLQKTDGNMAETARRLEVNYKTIYNKVKEYGLDESGT
ncbi:MAG: sigma-54 interaction domain-containing protein [Bradymonadaceae bacterium]